MLDSKVLKSNPKLGYSLESKKSTNQGTLSRGSVADE